MNIPEELKKYNYIPDDCPKFDKNNPDYRCSVDYDKDHYRISIANKEIQKEKKSVSQIIALVNMFLEKFKANTKCIFIDGLDVLLTVKYGLYDLIKEQYGLEKQSDIVWMRFTTDGYLGVVASSNDINFDYTTNSGKIIKSVDKEWDTNKIIIVPLPNIKSREDRLTIENMIGNYLHDNGTPIIDLYSHNFGCPCPYNGVN